MYDVYIYIYIYIYNKGLSRRPTGKVANLMSAETKRVDQEMTEPSWYLEISKEAFRELV